MAKPKPVVKRVFIGFRDEVAIAETLKQIGQRKTPRLNLTQVLQLAVAEFINRENASA